MSPLPWQSNKLILSDGAKAYLANATVPTPIPGVFSISAVLPDATSQAFFYRWAQFNLTGRGGFLPVIGAHVSAYYAYTTSQANNATANALNALSTSNPVIWGYVQYWDAQHGYAQYGYSNDNGVASILLASSNITLPTLPDGYFLGGYHIGISVPAVGVASQWFNWTVSPYPTGVAQPANGLAGPDFAPTQRFNSYYGAASISAVSVTANGAASATVNLGQTLAVKVTVEDLGTVPISQVAASLYYNATSPPTGLLASYETTAVHLTVPGQETNVTLSWKATLNTTGLNAFFSTNLTLVVDWNYNSISLGGGNLTRNVSVTFAPTTLTLASAVVLANGIANKTVELGQVLGVEVTVRNVGNATITGLSAELYYNATSSPSGLLASYNVAKPRTQLSRPAGHLHPQLEGDREHHRTRGLVRAQPEPRLQLEREQPLAGPWELLGERLARFRAVSDRVQQECVRPAADHPEPARAVRYAWWRSLQRVARRGDRALRRPSGNPGGMRRVFRRDHRVHRRSVGAVLDALGEPFEPAHRRGNCTP